MKKKDENRQNIPQLGVECFRCTKRMRIYEHGEKVLSKLVDHIGHISQPKCNSLVTSEEKNCTRAFDAENRTEAEHK